MLLAESLYTPTLTSVVIYMKCGAETATGGQECYTLRVHLELVPLAKQFIDAYVLALNRLLTNGSCGAMGLLVKPFHPLFASHVVLDIFIIVIYNV